MIRLGGLALLLLFAVACFLGRGWPALAESEGARLDLLEREQRLQALRRDVPGVPHEEFVQLVRQRDLATGQAAHRLAALQSDTRRPFDKPLEEQLAGSRRPELRPGGSLHARVLAEAGSIEARAALSALVAAVDLPAGPLELQVLELREGGAGEALPAVSELRAVGGQIVLSAALPDALAILEALAAGSELGLPAASVTSASLRRIEPDRWGQGLHRLATPPVRLSVSVEVLLGQGREDQ